MKKAILIVFAMAFALHVATVMLNSVFADTPYRAVREVERATDGAFRDGLFVGRIDAERGRKPHLASGRWSAQQDRSSFVAGYQQGYRQGLDLRVPVPEAVLQAAEQVGFRDGMADGIHDRQGLQGFRLNRSENYRRADRGYTEGQGNQGQYRQSYREAYCNGYQQGYYGDGQRVNTGDSGQIPSAS
jgi:hypothetical protein